RRCDQLPRNRAIALDIAGPPPVLDAHIAADDPAQFAEPLQERCVAGFVFGIVRYSGHEYPDAPHALRLLRACGERPRCRRAAEQRDELAPVHSITSSALPSSEDGNFKPSAFAALRLRISSNFVD